MKGYLHPIFYGVYSLVGAIIATEWTWLSVSSFEADGGDENDSIDAGACEYATTTKLTLLNICSSFRTSSYLGENENYQWCSHMNFHIMIVFIRCSLCSQITIPERQLI